MQTVIDKSDIIPRFSRNNPRKIELGCGHEKKSADYIGIDRLDTAATDIVGDVMEVLERIPDGTVSEVYSSHFVEHVDNIPDLLEELRRVLMDGGVINIVAPHFSNPYYYSDPTHRQFYGLYTFSYYCEDKIFRRQVPSYSRINGLELVGVKLNFKAGRPHYISYAIRRVFGLFFNSTDFFKEVYENSFSSIISCYDILYTVKKS